MSFAQRATFGRGRAGSGYALAAPRDKLPPKFCQNNFQKKWWKIKYVFFQCQVASDSKTNMLFEKLDPNYGGALLRDFRLEALNVYKNWDRNSKMTIFRKKSHVSKFFFSSRGPNEKQKNTPPFIFD